MTRKKTIVSVFGCLSLLAGCDGASDGPTTTDWQPVVAAYPYTGAHGETVCSAVERTDEGRHFMNRETFDFDAMNSALGGDGTLAPDVLSAIKAGGVAHVATCADARSMIKLQRAYVERDAGLPAGTPSATEAAQILDKVAEGNPSNLPYVVRVQPWDAGSGTFGTCSGALIGPRVLLTAAHCFGKSKPSSYSQIYAPKIIECRMPIRVSIQPATSEKTPDIRNVRIEALAMNDCAESAAMMPFSINSVWIGFENTGIPLMAKPLLITRPTVAITSISQRYWPPGRFTSIKK